MNILHFVQHKSFITFMDKMYNDLEDKENKTIFIDNASIHTSKKAKELYKKNVKLF